MALLMVLVALAVMMSVAAGLSVRYHALMSETAQLLDSFQARWYARASDTMAVKIIKQDISDSGGSVNLSQYWAQEGRTFPVEGGTIGGYVSNEQQFVNTYLPFADANTKALFGQTLAQLRAANEQLEQQKPKVLFADAVSAAHTSILVGELAKLLKQNGVDIGQHRLFQYLRENGYLIKRRGSGYNMPTQYAMERGWFEIKETAITHGDGHTSVNKTPKVTGKGQQYFINLFLKGA